jgi:predicted nucleic acid-binding protein
MKILFDTNVIVDILGYREPFFHDSNAILLLVASRDIQGIISAGSITDIYYLIRKYYMDADQALNSIIDILRVLLLVDTKACDIQEATKLGFPDFEDAVVAATASREKADYIITRNVTDFAKSPIPAISPSNFLKQN